MLHRKLLSLEAVAPEVIAVHSNVDEFAFFQISITSFSDVWLRCGSQKHSSSKLTWSSWSLIKITSDFITLLLYSLSQQPRQYFPLIHTHHHAHTSWKRCFSYAWTGENIVDNEWSPCNRTTRRWIISPSAVFQLPTFTIYRPWLRARHIVSAA